MGGLKKNYSAKRIINAIINANNAIASVNAKPKIAILNNSSFNDGFLEVPKPNAPKTIQILTPIHFGVNNNINSIEMCY